MRTHISTLISPKYFPAFAQVRMQAQHVFTQQVTSQEHFLHVFVLCRERCVQFLEEVVGVPLEGHSGLE